MGSSHLSKRKQQIHQTPAELILCQMDICEHHLTQQDMHKGFQPLYFQMLRSSYLCSRILVDGKLYDLKKDVSINDAKHLKTLAELERGVDGLFESFARLDSRISTVGQTAARIGDHLQSADSQRETASQTIELIKYLMEFNSRKDDLMELSPLFSYDSRVADAASIAQKLRSFAEEDIGRQVIAGSPVIANATASRGLEVAVANLQEYCNELENRLLARFDSVSQKKGIVQNGRMCQNFGSGTRLVLGGQDTQTSPSDVARGLSSLYREITDTVHKEAAIITAVFPSPNEV